MPAGTNWRSNKLEKINKMNKDFRTLIVIYFASVGICISNKLNYPRFPKYNVNLGRVYSPFLWNRRKIKCLPI